LNNDHQLKFNFVKSDFALNTLLQYFFERRKCIRNTQLAARDDSMSCLSQHLLNNLLAFVYLFIFM